jgi:hypothetical protein
MNLSRTRAAGRAEMGRRRQKPRDGKREELAAETFRHAVGASAAPDGPAVEGPSPDWGEGRPDQLKTSAPPSFGFGPKRFGPGVPSRHMKTNTMIPPT